jgi:hypothetical protein
MPRSAGAGAAGRRSANAATSRGQERKPGAMPGTVPGSCRGAPCRSPSTGSRLLVPWRCEDTLPAIGAVNTTRARVLQPHKTPRATPCARARNSCPGDRDEPPARPRVLATADDRCRKAASAHPRSRHASAVRERRVHHDATRHQCRHRAGRGSARHRVRSRSHVLEQLLQQVRDACRPLRSAPACFRQASA